MLGKVMAMMLWVMMMMEMDMFFMTVMMVMIYFWYISNIFPLCTLPSAPKMLGVKKKEGVIYPLLKSVNQPHECLLITNVYINIAKC